jgi:hypothetical protein
MISMITFTATALYSQTIPVAPAGSSVLPPPLMPTALGRPDVPSAASTVAPDGHEDDAVVVCIGATVGVAVATGAEVAGADVAAALELPVGLALPHAARAVAANPMAARDIQLALLRVTYAPPPTRSLSKPPAGAL